MNFDDYEICQYCKNVPKRKSSCNICKSVGFVLRGSQESEAPPKVPEEKDME